MRLNGVRVSLALSAVALSIARVAASASQSGGCTNWSKSFAPSALGVNGTIWALRFFDDDASGPSAPRLVACGNFSSAGGVAASHIAEFDGTAWFDLGAGAQGGPPLTLRALAVYDEPGAAPPALFVGGQFSMVGGGIPALNLARWDGQAWSDVGGGVTGTNVAVTSLIVYDPDGSGPLPAELVVAGQDILGGSIAKWNGSSWSQLGAGVNGDVHALAVFDEDGSGPLPAKLIVGGGFTSPGNHIAAWDGVNQTWSTVGGGSNDEVRSLTVWDAGAGSEVLVAGMGFSPSGPNVMRLSGNSWVGMPGLVGNVFALASRDLDGPMGTGAQELIAGGDLTIVGASVAENIARWNGSTWSPMCTGTSARVSALVISERGYFDPCSPTLFAGGDFTTAGGSPSDHIAAWNDTANAISTYCTTKVSSQFCRPVVGYSGTPSASSASPFLITAANIINNKNGILFYGLGGATANPWLGGTLCVKAPIARTPVQFSGGNPPPNDCSGTFSFDFNAHTQSSVDPRLVPGASVWAQHWYRDPGHPDGTNVGMTNALQFTICF